jgi:ComF family protein
MYLYQHPVDALIREMKFNQRPEIIYALGNDFATWLGGRLDTQPDVMIPVPMYRRRMMERGCNQALELARILNKRLSIPVDNQCCRRTCNTPSQTGIPTKQRRANVRGAFDITASFNYRHVVIVDDVVTTGSTVNEIATLFVRAGVKHIDVYALSRAGIDPI